MSQDGDIVAAFNDSRILRVHADMLCHPRKVTITTDGLRADSVARLYREQVYEYRFERVSRNEARRTNFITGKQDIVGNRPNAQGERINVTLYLKRQLANPNHAIFGTKGREVWYGGAKRARREDMDRAWDAIENATALRRADFSMWPHSERELHHYLALPCEDFDDEMAGRAAGREYTTVPDVDPDWDEALFSIARKRRFAIDWRALPGIDTRRAIRQSERYDLRHTIAAISLQRALVKPRLRVFRRV